MFAVIFLSVYFVGGISRDMSPSKKKNYLPIRRMAISATAKLNKKKLVDVLILFVLRVLAIHLSPINLKLLIVN